MSEENSDFSLDELIVEEEEMRAPALYPVSVIISQTEYDEQSETVENLKNKVKERILEKYSFKTVGKRRLKEGFLAFNGSLNTLECVYAREIPIRLDYERDDLEIHSKRVKNICPSYRVKVIVSFNLTTAKVVLFGGFDTMIAKALDFINFCIRACVSGGHRTYMPSFSKEEMTQILLNFGEDIQFLWIDPGESEKFTKIIEKKIKGEIKRIPEYIVHTKVEGYRIIASPFVINLIKEAGIRIREIEGRLPFAPGIKITTRVSSSGKILFYVPETLLGKESIYDFAQRLYERVMAKRTGPKQVTMGEFLAERSS